MKTSPIKVFYVPSGGAGRSYKLIQQGLSNHPRVVLVETAAESDYLFCHNDAWSRSLRLPAENLVFIDFHDDPHFVYPIECALYFKRSWSHRLMNGSPIFAMGVMERPPFMRPTAYAVMDEFVLPESPIRDIDVSCLLRPDKLKRKIILETLEALDFGDLNTRIGAVSSSGRDVFDREYLETLSRSRIVITANPDHCEGDSRLWEALANGALVLVDRMHTPLDHPLIDGEHCVFFDSEGINDLSRLVPMIDALAYYICHPDEASEIGRRGREHALRHHTAVARVDAMLRQLTSAEPGAQPAAAPAQPTPELLEVF